VNADQNLRLLREIEANRTFILSAYQQNPQLLANAELRIQQLLRPLPFEDPNVELWSIEHDSRVLNKS
jgi:hypothetical protein